MIDIILTLVFSSAVLIFMIYPAIKLTDWLETQITVAQKWHNPLLLSIVVMLSLIVGLFLQLA